MLEYLFIVPLGMGLITLFLPASAGRLALVATGLAHLVLSLGVLLGESRAMYPE